MVLVLQYSPLLNNSDAFIIHTCNMNPDIHIIIAVFKLGHLHTSYYTHPPIIPFLTILLHYENSSFDLDTKKVEKRVIQISRRLD